MIAIAEDDEKLYAARCREPERERRRGRDRRHARGAEPRPQRSLILGWNSRAASVINELDNYVVPGSSVTVVAHWSQAAKVIERECAELKNLTIDFREGDTTERRAARLARGRTATTTPSCSATRT